MGENYLQTFHVDTCSWLDKFLQLDRPSVKLLLFFTSVVTLATTLAILFLRLFVYNVDTQLCRIKCIMYSVLCYMHLDIKHMQIYARTLINIPHCGLIRMHTCNTCSRLISCISTEVQRNASCCIHVLKNESVFPDMSKRVIQLGSEVGLGLEAFCSL